MFIFMHICSGFFSFSCSSNFDRTDLNFIPETRKHWLF